MALRPGRAGGKGVLSAPVIRTAVAVGAAAVVVDSINRWHEQRRARLMVAGHAQDTRRRSSHRHRRSTPDEGGA
jgi:hypothetical protein